VRSLLLRLEAVLWLLCGLGILLGMILLPGYLLVVGIAVPLGFLPSEVLSFERVHMLAAHPLGRLVLLALAALPLWKGAHHLRSLSLDFHGHSRDAVVATLLYGSAVLGSLLAIKAVFRL